MKADRSRQYIDSGRNQQSAGKRISTAWSSAKITLAVHPWFGEVVTVQRMHSADAVVIERQAGDQRIVPVRWTDLDPNVALAATERVALERPCR